MQFKTLDQLSSHVFQQVKAQLTVIQTDENVVPTLLIGFSGGLDSCVLLHLLTSLQTKFENLGISAIHVNHGVHENSDVWARFCQQYCTRLQVPLVISRHQLNSVKSNRESVYRQLRYQVFRDHLPKKGMLLTAHHQHDQAETILFNLFRGAGLRGLSAMKPCLKFSSGLHLRPLLNVAHNLIHEYAQFHKLSWIDDPSNEDIAIDRNYIRQRVLPIIEQRWPAAQACISRSGANLIQAEQLINEIGIQDFSFCSQSDHPGVIDNAYLSVLNMDRYHQLSGARQFNLLRHWILTTTDLKITADQLQQISKDLCAEARSGLFELNTYQIRVYKNSLYLMQAMPKPSQSIEKPVISNDCYIFKHRCLSIMLKRKSDSQSTTNTKSQLRFVSRQGGERIRHHGQTQQLKSIYQDNAIPTWERELLPLVYQGNRLIAVPGVVLADDCPFVETSVNKYTVAVN